MPGMTRVVTLDAQGDGRSWRARIVSPFWKEALRMPNEAISVALPDDLMLCALLKQRERIDTRFAGKLNVR